MRSSRPTRHRGSGGNKKTPPSMHQGRCVRMTFKDTSREAKLHGLAVSFFMRPDGYSFSRFTLTRPKRGGDNRDMRDPPHAGNLFRISNRLATRPATSQTKCADIIPNLALRASYFRSTKIFGQRSWCLVLSAWCLVLNAECLVHGAWCLVLSA